MANLSKDREAVRAAVFLQRWLESALWKGLIQVLGQTNEKESELGQDIRIKSRIKARNGVF